MNQRGFACAEYAYRDFLGPAGDGRGFSISCFCPLLPGGAPVKKDAGVMWAYFWPDLAFDLVKGLVAGGASLALQAVAPMTLRALKRFRARWSARKAARKAGRKTSVNDDG